MQKKLIVLLSLLCVCFVGCGPKTLEERAEAGDAEAQYNLGWMYSNGDGVPQDHKEAVKWYRLAAGQGHAEALVNLGNMYKKARASLRTTRRQSNCFVWERIRGMPMRKSTWAGCTTWATA
jgi:TPR repeat protein